MRVSSVWVRGCDVTNVESANSRDARSFAAYERLTAFLAARIERQEQKYGPFDADVAGVRLALAILQDELDEARDEWRHERTLGGWDGTADEVADVAGVALRLLLALEDDLAIH